MLVHLALTQMMLVVSRFQPPTGKIFQEWMTERRRLGLQWVSAVDDLLSVRKALAAGLFANAAQYVETSVESRDKEHTGVDLYHLVRSTSHGQTFAPLCFTHCVLACMTAYKLALLLLQGRAYVHTCGMPWHDVHMHSHVLLMCFVGINASRHILQSSTYGKDNILCTSCGHVRSCSCDRAVLEVSAL